MSFLKNGDCTLCKRPVSTQFAKDQVGHSIIDSTKLITGQQLVKQKSISCVERRTKPRLGLVRQKSRASPAALKRDLPLSRKLSRKLDISFDRLDSNAFPFLFLNTSVSAALAGVQCAVTRDQPCCQLSRVFVPQ